MITTLFQLYNGLAAVASLPALLLCHLYKSIRLFVLWTFPLRMEFTVAKHAYLGSACSAAGVLSASHRVNANLRGLDPLAASFAGTVQAVGGGVLLIFPVPEVLEFVVK
jgi:hypothetical protein